MAGRLAGSLYNTAYQMEVQHMTAEVCKKKLVQAYYVADFTGDIITREHIREHFEKMYGEFRI